MCGGNEKSVKATASSGRLRGVNKEGREKMKCKGWRRISSIEGEVCLGMVLERGLITISVGNTYTQQQPYASRAIVLIKHIDLLVALLCLNSHHRNPRPPLIRTLLTHCHTSLTPAQSQIVQNIASHLPSSPTNIECTTHFCSLLGQLTVPEQCHRRFPEGLGRTSGETGRREKRKKGASEWTATRLWS